MILLWLFSWPQMKPNVHTVSLDVPSVLHTPTLLQHVSRQEVQLAALATEEANAKLNRLSVYVIGHNP